MSGTARPAPWVQPESPLGVVGRALAARERLVLGITGIVAFFTLWELGARLGVVETYFFSQPTAVAAAGLREVQLPRFWKDFATTAQELLTGYLGAALVAIPLGLAAGWFRRLQYTLDPWLNFFNSLPRVALLPILVIVVGLGIMSKIAIAFLAAFFAIIIPTIQGVRTVDRRFVEVARSFGASQWRLFTSVVAPATVPFVVTGLRLGLGRALISVVVGELYAATDGLGVMIDRAAEAAQADRMMFGVLLFTAAGILGVEAIRRLEVRFQRWRPREVRR
jgi:ABC-type nitrate/sulfonate/bicarbonate transport system permease component